MFGKNGYQPKDAPEVTPEPPKGNKELKVIDDNVLYSVVDKARKYDELVKLYKDKKLHCDFCGKSQDQVKRLISGPGVYICDECVELCHEIITEELSPDNKDGKDE
jgi:hypothetical protein